MGKQHKMGSTDIRTRRNFRQRWFLHIFQTGMILTHNLTYVFKRLHHLVFGIWSEEHGHLLQGNFCANITVNLFNLLSAFFFFLAFYLFIATYYLWCIIKNIICSYEKIYHLLDNSKECSRFKIFIFQPPKGEIESIYSSLMPHQSHRESVKQTKCHLVASDSPTTDASILWHTSWFLSSLRTHFINTSNPWLGTLPLTF